MDLVSIVIPCYNPGAWLQEAIASARAQTYGNIEVVLVNDGTTDPESLAHIHSAVREVDVCLEQPNRGLAAARNKGFGAARGCYIVPLDSDDLILPGYVAECMAALRASPQSAFAYSDCFVFGKVRHIDRLPEYNLYELLNRNFLTYCAVIRKEDWEQAGGYDESMRLGYEDWEFWLRLGRRHRLGCHVPMPLFGYRKHGHSLYDVALAHHTQIVSYIQNKHSELYQYDCRARIKALWSPAVCIAGSNSSAACGIEDVQFADPASPLSLPLQSAASAFLIASPGGAAPQSAECAVLAIWAGHRSLRLPDGSIALSRTMAASLKDTGLVKLPPLKARMGRGHITTASRVSQLHRHLLNAELLSWRTWIQHPLESTTRLIPLRVKERINALVRRPVFDLSFYMQFQPGSVMVGSDLVELPTYFPKPLQGRPRIVLVTPHLGPGGAEKVLFDLASSIPRSRFEILLIATQSYDDGWVGLWKEHADHVYDLARFIPPKRMAAAVSAIAQNWRCHVVVVQNSLYGYAALPQIKRESPTTKIVDLIHSIDDLWDQVAVTREVDRQIDVRVAVSNAIKQRLLASGTFEERIRVIRSGVDLERFCPSISRAETGARKILFAGRLDPAKRPLLLVEIATRLVALRKARDFRFIIAGEGPEGASLRRRVHRAGLDALFEFMGHVEDVAPLFAICEIAILPSRTEGIPLAAVEALACSRPVIASNVGSVNELIDQTCGILIEVGPNEASLFAVGIDSLLNQPELCERLGTAGRKKVEAEYDHRRAWSAYRELFS